MISVCFVCLGNICRSPTAEGVMLKKLEEQDLHETIRIDSAGTSAYHVGEKADARSRECALKRGYQLPSRARQLTNKDIQDFDYIIAMDMSNKDNIEKDCTSEEQRSKIYMFRQFEEGMDSTSNVPDPYYGGTSGFDNVLDICERGCEGLIRFLKERHMNK
jgi:protein-tyrosine phosphatase